MCAIEIEDYYYKVNLVSSIGELRMRLEFCLVFVIYLTLNISQENVQGYSNIGLIVQNLTRLPTNETCDRNNRNCKYYMKLCFSLAKNDDCSLFDRTSLTWFLKPGQSKILRRGDDVVQYIENPLRFPEVNTWKAQEVVLRAGVRKSGHLDFTEEILIKEKLPYPINDINRLEENRTTNCSAHFCLTIALYMWCDNIPGCVAINPTSTSIKTTNSITSDYPTTASLIQTTSLLTSDNSTTTTSIKAARSATSGNSTVTTFIKATSSIISGNETTPVPSAKLMKRNLSPGEIVGIVIACVAVGVGLMSISIWKYNKKRESRRISNIKQETSEAGEKIEMN